MKMSKMFMPTLREVPADAEITSHQLMLRAGMIRKMASGVYNQLPMGIRVFNKIQEIIREELNKKGCQEILCSALIPAELWKESGRWDVMGAEMMRLKDRNDRDFCLGPTHEEVFTDLIKQEITSYKQLPLNLYQIQVKYRDERRPRFGVMRTRSFTMKDAYSFDTDEAGLDKSYQDMFDAYTNIFARCGLDNSPVQADTGAIGGSVSAEFMVKSEVGEDEIVFCSGCDYAANMEKAVAVVAEPSTEEMKELKGDAHKSVGTSYEVKTDNDSIYSIVYSKYETAGSSDIQYKAYTIDKKNQAVVTLNSLFKDNSYIDIISNNIKEQMREQMKTDNSKVYFIDSSDDTGDNFDKIKADQTFYINSDGNIVILFNKYDVAPGYMGAPEFVIPTDVVSNILLNRGLVK